MAATARFPARLDWVSARVGGRVRQVHCAVHALGQGGLTEMISAALQSSRSTDWHMWGGTVQ